MGGDWRGGCEGVGNHGRAIWEEWVPHMPPCHDPQPHPTQPTTHPQQQSPPGYLGPSWHSPPCGVGQCGSSLATCHPVLPVPYRAGLGWLGARLCTFGQLQPSWAVTQDPVPLGERAMAPCHLVGSCGPFGGNLWASPHPPCSLEPRAGSGPPNNSRQWGGGEGGTGVGSRGQCHVQALLPP